MAYVYDVTAPKKTANCSVNSDLLSQARKLHLNVSSLLENALNDAVKLKKREEWISGNSEPIKRYNNKIKEQGLFSDGMRTF